MHEITLLQGLSLAALVFVLGIDFWLEALFLFRPINRQFFQLLLMLLVFLICVPRLTFAHTISDISNLFWC